MAKYRGSSKTYSVPNKPLSLFKITAGDGSGGGLEPPCPRNAAGQRVSEAGAGEGPLHGGPRDADGFLMKAFDDALKIVIYEDMTQGEREFSIAFMEQDTPAPPGTPNACLSKYERAIIATYNDITTAEMNGDTHINELLKREAGKPRPERLPENPLVLKGVAIQPTQSHQKPKASSSPGFSTAPAANAAELPKFDDLLRAAATQDLRIDEEWDKAAAALTTSNINLVEIPVDIKTMPGYRKPPVEFHAISRGIGIPPHWITNDFVYHYFFGRGQMVDLRWVKLGEPFEKAQSVQRAVDSFIAATSGKLAAGYSFADRSETNVTLDGPLFSLFSVGDSSFFREVNCDQDRCLYHFYIRDKFRDPLDIGIETGGSEYDIKYDFYRAYKLS